VAKRKTTRKKTTKKTTRKKTAARRKPAPKKKTTKKKVAKKTTKKKVAKKTTKKKVAKKTTKKKVAKKTTKKTVAKKTTKKKVAKKTTKKKTSSSSSRRGRRGQTVAEAASEAKVDSKGYVFIKGRRVRMISTKGQVQTRKKRVTRPAEVTKTQEQVKKKTKTKLSAKELKHYQSVLLQKRAELVGDLSAMERQALQSGGDNISHMPIHMADIGTDTYDQDFMLGMAETEREHLREIDEALMRIQDKTYGVCQMTGKQIPKARLDAKPWAKYSIEAARKLEGQWNH
jgi:RNA polymerase-binding protein DksA